MDEWSWQKAIVFLLYLIIRVIDEEEVMSVSFEPFFKFYNYNS